MQESQVRTLAPGAILARRGDSADASFVVLEGVLVAEIDGHVLGEIGPGALVGEGRGERPATLRARTWCRVAILSARQPRKRKKDA